VAFRARLRPPVALASRRALRCAAERRLLGAAMAIALVAAERRLLRSGRADDDRADVR
jgi:hypothetical protein